jgi:diguanylate cyclase (GGDEF)-like protein
MSVHLPNRFIGISKTLISGEIMSIGTPIYEKDGFYQWLVLDIEKDQKDYVLNDLFYRFLENILIYKKTKDKEENLLLLASTDDVTGLYNQRKLAEDLEKAIVEHEEKHDTFSIMFIDLDHFKQVNDNYGHVVGSKLLSDLGKVLALILRQSDHIYRYGGDEFVIIMPNVDVGTVHEVALRVLDRIKNYKFEIGNGEIYNMSISIGIAEYPTDASSAKEIVQFADDMMYESKKSGRGKVFHWREVGNVNAHIK